MLKLIQGLPVCAKNISQNISQDFHWNLNSVSVYDYSKLFLQKAYNILDKFDIICFSEIYLDSTAPTDDDKLQNSGYTLIHSDYPSNIKHGGFCIYRKFFTIKSCKYSLFTQMDELQNGDITCTFAALYR